MKKYLPVIFTMFFLCSSCATATLWETNDPDKYLQVKFSDITEQELIQRGVKYYKDENTHSYYVSKSSQEKFKDYAVRVFATPVALAIDATTVMIFGIAMAVTNNTIDDYTVDPEAAPHGPATEK